MSPREPGRSSTTKAWRDMGRAAGGALVFSLPMLMTMEMWALGFTMDRTRMVVMILVTIPLLMGLSRHIGFERTHGWRDDLLDSLVACGIAIAVSLVVLVVFGTIGPGMAAGEIVGKVAIQMVPGAIGALLARAQFRASRDEEDGAEREESYGGELFLMAVGSLFLGFNVAPTEETVLISFQMTPWHAFTLVLLSLALMHGFVFALGFAGGSELSPQTPWWSAFLRFTLPGYVIAAAISLFVLWLFGRTDGVDLGHVVMATVVLAFPSSIGAAAARLVL
jgi:putative integral membrane protein (TIGR02587 family)